ncbi:hypothetical protein B5P46_28525 [Rhizobium leguminosarum]|uniref:Transposase n=1 Tax=Rhizobium leguminosarum TaxID=384 RepID=A0A4V1NZS1_RHILE|nr:hypothetical protein B5P46_28525 [Rhizobium leguminosarum]
MCEAAALSADWRQSGRTWDFRRCSPNKSKNDTAPACVLVRGLPAKHVLADRAYDASTIPDFGTDTALSRSFWSDGRLLITWM